MLHAGLSLQVFKKWASDEKNMVGFLVMFVIFFAPFSVFNLWEHGGSSR